MINGLALAVASAEPIIGLREVWIEYLLKYQIDALADHPIHYYGMPNFRIFELPSLGIKALRAGLKR